MHPGVIAHAHPIDETNVELLRTATFVFITMDSGPEKRLILERLEEWGTPHIDSGMGVYQRETSLGGILRTSFGNRADGHLLIASDQISFVEPDDGEYDQNIQIAELNALAACHAVVRWKKHLGFYLDEQQENASLYTIEGNSLLNQPDEQTE